MPTDSYSELFSLQAQEGFCFVIHWADYKARRYLSSFPEMLLSPMNKIFFLEKKNCICTA